MPSDVPIERRIALDLIVMVALIRLIGWHWEFLPWIPRTLRRRFSNTHSTGCPGSLFLANQFIVDQFGQEDFPGLD
jgi:hypothetical protein